MLKFRLPTLQSVLYVYIYMKDLKHSAMCLLQLQSVLYVYIYERFETFRIVPASVSILSNKLTETNENFKSCI